MVKFKYNVLKTNELCNDFFKQMRDYSDLNEKVYMNIKSSKNVWNDQASFSFYDIVLKDERICKDIKKNLENYIGCISAFSNSLQKIFFKKRVILSDLDIKYDGDYVNNCLDKLNEIDELLTSCVNEFNTTIYPLNFEYYHEVNSLYRNVSVMKKKVNDISSDISYIDKEINSLIKDTLNKEKKIDVLLCDKKIIKLDSSLVALDSVK